MSMSFGIFLLLHAQAWGGRDFVGVSGANDEIVFGCSQEINSLMNLLLKKEILIKDVWITVMFDSDDSRCANSQIYVDDIPVGSVHLTMTPFRFENNISVFVERKNGEASVYRYLCEEICEERNRPL